MELPVRHSTVHDAAGRHGLLRAAHFADIDEQAAELTGWNQRYLQLSAGLFSGSVHRLQLEGVGLFLEDLQQAVHQTGWVAPQVVALGVPVLLRGDSRFCGQPGDESAMHVFSGADGFEFRSPQRHVMLGIEIDAGLFEAHGLTDGEPGEPSAAQRFAARARLHVGDAAAIAALRGFVLDLFQRAQSDCAPWLNEAQRQQVRDELLDLVAAATAHPASARCATHGDAAPRLPLRCPTHLRLAERARDLVVTRLDDPPTVAELCNLLGVSRRTLQSCFHATWGMGPLAWLNTLRLNAVRQRLKTAHSVTEAATQLGFWHFGHFANDYRELFGELPSQTLARHRGAAARH